MPRICPYEESCLCAWIQCNVKYCIAPEEAWCPQGECKVCDVRAQVQTPKGDAPDQPEGGGTVVRPDTLLMRGEDWCTDY